LALPLLAVLLLGGLLGLASMPAPVAAEDVEADVDVTFHPVPSINVARGATLAYKLRIENRGEGTMAYARVYMPYNRELLTLTNAEFQDEDDYVFSIDEFITVHFDLVGQESERFAVLYFQVADYLPNGTVINMLAGFDWEDQHGNYELDRQTNSAPVVVQDQNLTSDFVWMVADPVQAPAGNKFTFFSDRFLPGEDVVPTVRTLDGTEQPVMGDNSQEADANGRVHIHLSSADFAPGTYKVYLKGEHSDLQAVADIVVQ
jgi:hypothetical protein